MRRIAALAFVLLALATACAERDDPTVTQPGGPAEETSAEPTPEEPAELPGASCESVNAGNPSNFPDFTAVKLESNEGIDRITFLFEPEAGAPEEPPLHFVNFTDQLTTDGEGAPVEVDGEAFLVVSFQAVGVDLSGEQPVPVYTGPKRFTPEFETLREVVHLGDFEGQVSWGLGLSHEACFVVDATPEQLTLEFAAAAD